MKVIKIFLFGIAGAFCVASPVLLAFLAVGIAHCFGVQNAGFIGGVVAVLWVCVLPVGILGNALYASYRLKREFTPEAVSEGPAPLPGEAYKQLIDVWKTSEEVQQHFNGLELQIRNFAVTLLVGVLGATGFALKEHYVVSVFGSVVSLAVVVCIAGIPGWLGFYFMDRHWYHRLLLGSVKHALEMEKDVRLTFPQLSLSTKIGDESPSVWGPFRIRSSEKIDIFYSIGLMVLIVLLVVLLLMGAGTPPVEHNDTTPGANSGTTVIQNNIEPCTSVSSGHSRKSPPGKAADGGKKSQEPCNLGPR